jgi:hypothetical protein
VQGLGIY